MADGRPVQVIGPKRRCGDRAAGGGTGRIECGAVGAGRSGKAVRSGPGSAAAGATGAGERSRAGAAADDAPHHFRWLVDRSADQELGELYRAEVAGEEAQLAELAVQYADYAVWQREYLQGERLEKQLGYWKRAVGGRAARLALPAVESTACSAELPRRRGGSIVLPGS